MPNRALLIGVPEYDSDAINNLDFVPNDLNHLGGALANVGYEISTLGGPGDRSPTHNAILTGVYEFCRHELHEDEVAIIYFSGHGLHYQGRDYLVPADATLGDELIEQVMVPLDFSAVYEQSRAAAIFFFIDACREGIELGEKSSLGYREWSHGKLEAVRSQQSAYVFSCGPGEVSRFVPGDSGFSLFTRALAETFEARPGVTLTFGRVRKELQRRVDALADRYEKKRQSVRVIAEGGAEDEDLSGVQLATTGLRKDPTRAGQPNVDIEAISEFTISDDDLKLFSYDLDGTAPWLEGAVPVIHLLRASAALGRSIGSIVTRLAEFEPLGITIPPLDLDGYEERTLEHADLVIFPSHLEDRSARPGEIAPVHILYAASRLQKPVDAVLRRLELFKPLGIDVPDVDPAQVKGLMVDRRDLTILSAMLDAAQPWIKGNVDVIHVLRAANELGESVGFILDRLAAFAPCGITLPEGIDPAAHDLTISDDDIVLLSEDADGEDPWVQSPVPVGHILCAAMTKEVPVGTVVSQLRRFEAVGIQLPEIDEEATADLEVERGDVSAVSRDFDGISPWLEGPIPSARLIVTAHHDKQSVGAVFDRLKRYEAAGLELPEIDRDAAGELFVSDEDMRLLTAGEGEEEWLSDEIPIAHLLYAANRFDETVAEAAERARRFEAVGLTIPTVDADAVSDLRVEERDLILLSTDLDGMGPWISQDVTWFHLLRAARRLEEPLDRVVTRLRKFAPVGYAVPTRGKGPIKGLTVSEQDLALLSRDLDGYAPWVGETGVSFMHVFRASAKFGEPVAAILERLRPFLALGLILPDVDGDELGSLQVTDEDLIVLSENLDGTAPWVRRLPIGHVLAAAHVRGEPVGTILKQLKRFAGLGLPLPELGDRPGKARISEQDLVLLSRGLDARGPWLEGDVPVVHLLKAANRLEEPVGETLERLHKLESLNAIRLSPAFGEAPGAWRRRLRRMV